MCGSSVLSWILRFSVCNEVLEKDSGLQLCRTSHVVLGIGDVAIKEMLQREINSIEDHAWHARGAHVGGSENLPCDVGFISYVGSVLRGSGNSLS